MCKQLGGGAGGRGGGGEGLNPWSPVDATIWENLEGADMLKEVLLEARWEN